VELYKHLGEYQSQNSLGSEADTRPLLATPKDGHTRKALCFPFVTRGLDHAVCRARKRARSERFAVQEFAVIEADRRPNEP
jgi:hypothetical protein